VLDESVVVDVLVIFISLSSFYSVCTHRSTQYALAIGYKLPYLE